MPPIRPNSWLRIVDLSPARLSEFLSICDGLGLSIPAISTARRSIIDPEHGDEYLSYSHRVIDIAAHPDPGVISLALCARGIARELAQG